MKRVQSAGVDGGGSTEGVTHRVAESPGIVLPPTPLPPTPTPARTLTALPPHIPEHRSSLGVGEVLRYHSDTLSEHSRSQRGAPISFRHVVGAGSEQNINKCTFC